MGGLEQPERTALPAEHFVVQRRRHRAVPGHADSLDGTGVAIERDAGRGAAVLPRGGLPQAARAVARAYTCV